MPQTTPSTTSILAIPTDTCYGLACGFYDMSGYWKIHELKGRDPKKPFALVVERFEDIGKYVCVTLDQLDFLRNYPHPFTLLAEPIIPLPDFLDRQRYVFLGLRVAERCLDEDIHKELSFPLFLTSANRSAEPECFTREEVLSVFDSQVTILGERSGCHLPSDIFFFVGDTLERGYRRRNYG